MALKDEADATSDRDPLPFTGTLQFLPKNLQRSLLHRSQRSYQREESALAAAGRSNQQGHFPCMDLKVEAVKNLAAQFSFPVVVA